MDYNSDRHIIYAHKEDKILFGEVQVMASRLHGKWLNQKDAMRDTLQARHEQLATLLLGTEQGDKLPKKRRKRRQVNHTTVDGSVQVSSTLESESNGL